MARFSFNRLFTWGVLISLGTAFSLSPQSPLEIIKTSNQQVLEIYNANEKIDHALKNEIIQIIESVTDLDEISNRTTSSFCCNLSSEQCAEFNQVFKQLLRASSMSKVGRYRADRFEYLEEKIEGNKALVKTTAYYEDEYLTLDYLLEYKNNKWKIINYVTDDVDTIRNYRKQFIRLFAKYTFSEVIARLNKKLLSLEEEENTLNLDNS